QEEAARGVVGFRVFKIYAKAATYFFTILSFFGYCISQSLRLGLNFWLERWARASESERTNLIGKLLGVYAFLAVLYVFVDIGVNLLVFIGAGYRAAKRMHSDLLDRILRLPM
ncbi:hypothetical protein BGW38_010461, partial [Lunasporangiospora selenospora]